MRAIKALVRDAARATRDDMLHAVDANLEEMGLVDDVRLPGGIASGDVEVRLAMPHRGRPMWRYLGNPLAARVRAILGVRSVTVRPADDGAWGAHRMASRAWEGLGLPEVGQGPDGMAVGGQG